MVARTRLKVTLYVQYSTVQYIVCIVVYVKARVLLGILRSYDRAS